MIAERGDALVGDIIKRCHDEMWGDYHVIAWEGVKGRYIAEAKKGKFNALVGFLDTELSVDVQFEIGDTMNEALRKLKRKIGS